MEAAFDIWKRKKTHGFQCCLAKMTFHRPMSHIGAVALYYREIFFLGEQLEGKGKGTGGSCPLPSQKVL